MHRRLPLLTCLTLALTALLGAAPSAPAPTSPFLGSLPRQDLSPDDLDAIVEERLAELAQLSLDELWREAQRVAVLVGDEAGAAFDAALERALDRAPDGRAVLFLVAARALGDDVDWERLGRALEPLFAHPDGELARGAAELVASSQLTSADPDLREELTDSLLKTAGDAGRDPRLRVACAVAAHRIGKGGQTPRARSMLKAFLESADPALRAKGALAMAGLGIFDGVPGVESELNRLAALPGEDGRLADAYLKQQRIREHMQTKLRRAATLARELTLGAGTVSPDLQRVDRLIDLIQDAHIEGDKADRDELIEAALDGMLRSLDSHSAYFSPETYKKFERDLEAEYGGIGAYVGEDPDPPHLFTITRPIYSGPAYRAGLGTDDKIVRIDDWPTIGEDVDAIIKRLKGRPGTKVRLYVWRRGMDPNLLERPSEDMLITIERAQITIPPVHFQMLPGKLGLVELTTFSRVASAELEAAIVELLAQGMRGLILDLRHNTGGLLTEARAVGDLFLEQGKTVVSTRSRVLRTRKYDTEEPAVLPEELPLVVLINRFSASASEIVAGALQDHGRALLVGQRSFGKGSVQNLIPLQREVEDKWLDENRNGRYDDWETITTDHDGDGEFDYSPRVKLTIEEYLLPTGRSIHRQLDDEGNIVSAGGVEPDVEVGPTRRESWRLIEMRKLRDTRTLRNWVHEHFAENREIFEQLALEDLDDWSAYRGFEQLYAGLDSVLSRDDVRVLLRMEVRRLVQDTRGHAFPMGDFQEDVQLQAAIRAVLAELGEEPTDHVPYAASFDTVDQNGIVRGSETPLGLSARELDHALALIAEAEQGDRPLTRAKLQELSELIRSIKKN